MNRIEDKTKVLSKLKNGKEITGIYKCYGDGQDYETIEFYPYKYLYNGKEFTNKGILVNYVTSHQ